MLTLRNYLILMLVLIAALPLALFWAWPHSRALQSEIAEVQDRHLLIARNLGAALQRYHRDATAAFDYAGGAMLTGAFIPQARPLLEGLRFTRICVVDAATGRSLAGLDVSRLCPAMLSQDRRIRIASLAREGETVLTGVEAGEDGAPTLMLLRRSGGRIAVGALDTSYFRELGRAIAFGVRGHAVVTDHRGRVLSHPLPAWEREMRDISRISAVARMLAGERGVETFHSPALKDDMIAGFTAVAGPGWGVMVPQPIGELRAKASRLNASAMSVFAIGLLLAVLAACRLAVILARPVERASEAARKVANGELDARIEGSSRLMPVELRALTTAFNDMAVKVREARHSVEDARRAAEAASDCKTGFLRTVAHELRSPLNAIIGFAELLAAEKSAQPGSAHHRKVAKDIGAGGRHLLSLTNDLLDLARIEAGQYDLAEETVGLDEIAARAVRYVEIEARSGGTQVELVVEEPAPAVRGDERALFQSVLNLASNAVRYSAQGGRVQIAVRRLESGVAEIVVADDGPGIAPEDIERVLLPFQRVASRATREVRGTGLGLPIVVQLVRLHGGSFELTSTLGCGTRARIVLPRERVIEQSVVGLRSAA